MATTFTRSNKFTYRLANKEVNLASDTMKVILCTSSLTYSPATHGVYSDVSSYELTTGNGYTAGGITASRGENVLTQDDVNNCTVMDFEDIEITPTGDIGPFLHIIMYDDTITEKTIVGCWTRSVAKTITTDESKWVLSGLSVKIGEPS